MDTSSNDNTQQDVIEQIQSRKNYGGFFNINGKKQGCYTKKQMKSLYPAKNFELAGEYVEGSLLEPSGSLQLGAKPLPLYNYRSHNRLLYCEKGYVAVGEDRYAVLLSNVAALRAGILLLLVALILFAVIIGPGLLKGKGEPNPTTNLPDLEQGAVDWTGQQPQDTGGVTAGIAIPGYKSITVAANQADVKVNFNNPKTNPCYFVISLVLDDGTVLYQSKMVEPGKGIYDITLSQALSPGEYGAAVKYETYSLTDLTPMNGAEVQIALIAK